MIHKEEFPIFSAKSLGISKILKTGFYSTSKVNTIDTYICIVVIILNIPSEWLKKYTEKEILNILRGKIGRNGYHIDTTSTSRIKIPKN